MPERPTPQGFFDGGGEERAPRGLGGRGSRKQWRDPAPPERRFPHLDGAGQGPPQAWARPKGVSPSGTGTPPLTGNCGGAWERTRWGLDAGRGVVEGFWNHWWFPAPDPKPTGPYFQLGGL